jgi:hypothetical protein
MRYLVHAPTKGVPYLGSVLTPRMTRTYAGWSSRGEIYGQPGTQAIGIKGPVAIHSGINDMANSGTYRSVDAPNVIYPPLYWEAAKVKEHAPVSRISDNQMPVPAKRAPNVLISSPYRSRKGGQRQVYQPQVVQTWRGMKGTSNG